MPVSMKTALESAKKHKTRIRDLEALNAELLIVLEAIAELAEEKVSVPNDGMAIIAGNAREAIAKAKERG